MLFSKCKNVTSYIYSHSINSNIPKLDDLFGNEGYCYNMRLCDKLYYGPIQYALIPFINGWTEPFFSQETNQWLDKLVETPYSCLEDIVARSGPCVFDYVKFFYKNVNLKQCDFSIFKKNIVWIEERYGIKIRYDNFHEWHAVLKDQTVFNEDMAQEELLRDVPTTEEVVSVYFETEDVFKGHKLPGFEEIQSRLLDDSLLDMLLEDCLLLLNMEKMITIEEPCVIIVHEEGEIVSGTVVDYKDTELVGLDVLDRCGDDQYLGRRSALDLISNYEMLMRLSYINWKSGNNFRDNEIISEITSAGFKFIVSNDFYYDLLTKDDGPVFVMAFDVCCHMESGGGYAIECIVNPLVDLKLYWMKGMTSNEKGDREKPNAFSCHHRSEMWILRFWEKLKYNLSQSMPGYTTPSSLTNLDDLFMLPISFGDFRGIVKYLDIQRNFRYDAWFRSFLTEIEIVRMNLHGFAVVSPRLAADLSQMYDAFNWLQVKSKGNERLLAYMVGFAILLDWKAGDIYDFDSDVSDLMYKHDLHYSLFDEGNRGYSKIVMNFKDLREYVPLGHLSVKHVQSALFFGKPFTSHDRSVVWRGFFGSCENKKGFLVVNVPLIQDWIFGLRLTYKNVVFNGNFLVPPSLEKNRGGIVLSSYFSSFMRGNPYKVLYAKNLRELYKKYFLYCVRLSSILTFDAVWFEVMTDFKEETVQLMDHVVALRDKGDMGYSIYDWIDGFSFEAYV